MCVFGELIYSMHVCGTSSEFLVFELEFFFFFSPWSIGDLVCVACPSQMALGSIVGTIA
jgi:hypothetical protein